MCGGSELNAIGAVSLQNCHSYEHLRRLERKQCAMNTVERLGRRITFLKTCPHRGFEHCHQYAGRNAVSGNVSDVAGPFALGFGNVDEISADFAAGLRESIEFKLGAAFLNRGNERGVDFASELDLGLDAKVTLTQAPDEQHEQKVSEDNREHGAGAK